jgi:hypothetical protein
MRIAEINTNPRRSPLDLRAFASISSLYARFRLLDEITEGRHFLRAAGASAHGATGKLPYGSLASVLPLT